jgi:hypothetical protein
MKRNLLARNAHQQDGFAIGLPISSSTAATKLKKQSLTLRPVILFNTVIFRFITPVHAVLHDCKILKFGAKKIWILCQADGAGS